MRKHLWNEKTGKTLGWALMSGLLFFFSGIVGVGWEQCGAMLFATLTCVALKTPVYWLYEHGWDWAFKGRSRSCTCSCTPTQMGLSKGARL
jgi:hypothetical protein